MQPATCHQGSTHRLDASLQQPLQQVVCSCIGVCHRQDCAHLMAPQWKLCVGANQHLNKGVQGARLAGARGALQPGGGKQTRQRRWQAGSASSISPTPAGLHTAPPALSPQRSPRTCHRVKVRVRALATARRCDGFSACMRCRCWAASARQPSCCAQAVGRRASASACGGPSSRARTAASPLQPGSISCPSRDIAASWRWVVVLLTPWSSRHRAPAAPSECQDR